MTDGVSLKHIDYAGLCEEWGVEINEVKKRVEAMDRYGFDMQHYDKMAQLANDFAQSPFATACFVVHTINDYETNLSRPTPREKLEKRVFAEVLASVSKGPFVNGEPLSK